MSPARRALESSESRVKVIDQTSESSDTRCHDRSRRSETLTISGDLLWFIQSAHQTSEHTDHLHILPSETLLHHGIWTCRLKHVARNFISNNVYNICRIFLKLRYHKWKYEGKTDNSSWWTLAHYYQKKTCVYFVHEEIQTIRRRRKLLNRIMCVGYYFVCETDGNIFYVQELMAPIFLNDKLFSDSVSGM